MVSLSTSHNKANINRTHEQSLEAYKEIRATYPDLDVIVDLATTFGCPFEGKYEDPNAVVAFLKDYVDTGISFSKILAAAKHEKELIEGNYSGHHIDIEQETPCKA